MTQNTPFLRGLPPSVTGWGSEYGAADVIELPSVSRRAMLFAGSNGPRPIWLHADFLSHHGDEETTLPPLSGAGDGSKRTALGPEAIAVEDVLEHLRIGGFDGALQNARADHIAAAKDEQRPSLKTLRARLGMSQVSLARQIGTSQSRIARIEAKREEIGLSFARRMATALSVSLDELAIAYDA